MSWSEVRQMALAYASDPKRWKDELEDLACVESVSDDRASGDGITVYLGRGWWNPTLESHEVYGATVDEVRAAVSEVQRCACSQCSDYGIEA